MSNAFMSDLANSVRELRRTYGDNQQSFAQRVGLSPRAIANYETNRMPNPKALLKFAKLAAAINRSDLASAFTSAFHLQVGESTIDVTDELHRAALVAIHENNEPEWIERELATLVRRARKGHPLAYPLILNGDELPDQNMRIAYLETLLVELRLRSGQSAQTLLEQLAAERAEQTGKTKEAAYVEILIANPELYTRYRQERAEAGRDTQFSESLATAETKQKHPRQKSKDHKSAAGEKK